jgi:SAM-dependent methyltransferase
MNDPLESRSEKARVFYDAAAAVTGDLSFMNYGYAPLSPLPGENSGPEQCCLDLYRRLIGDADLRRQQVLEVSCGRGGGAAYVMDGYRPANLVGVDISERNIDIAARRFAGVNGLSFEAGKAEKLPFAHGSFDAVLNVEASHLYDDHARFFAEVYRVLRPRGRFFYADLFWSNSDPLRVITEAGLDVTSSEDITENVLQSLELDSARREQLVSGSIPEHLQHDYRDWSGIKGHRAYNRFATREWIYRCVRAERRR